MTHIVHSTTETVWRYDLDVNDTITVDLPRGARFLNHVETTGTVISLWALVEPTNPKVTRTLYVRGTGHPMRDIVGCYYVGTASVYGDFTRLVWSVFEDPRPPKEDTP